MKTGLVLVNFHSEDATIKMAKQFSAYDFIDHIVIVDNEMTKESAKRLTLDDPKIKNIWSVKNSGYSKANNFGMRYLERQGCDCFIIANSDIDVSGETIRELLAVKEKKKEYGALAPILLDNHGKMIELRVEPMGYKRLLTRIIGTVDRNSLSVLKEKDGIIDQTMVSGSFFVADAKAMKASGYFDSNVFLYREEEILGIRMKRAGYKLGVVRKLKFTHLHDYAGTSVSDYIKQFKREFVSERYLFRKYLGAGKAGMVYVSVMQFLFAVVTILRNERNKLREKFR